jgi:hypothetical protein
MGRRTLERVASLRVTRLGGEVLKLVRLPEHRQPPRGSIPTPSTRRPVRARNPPGMAVASSRGLPGPPGSRQGARSVTGTGSRSLVEARRVAERDGRWLATVLTADPRLEAGPGRAGSRLQPARGSRHRPPPSTVVVRPLVIRRAATNRDDSVRLPMISRSRARCRRRRSTGESAVGSGVAGMAHAPQPCGTRAKQAARCKGLRAPVRPSETVS